MNPEDVLAQLKDIHGPTEVSWWPLAPGFYALLVIVVLLLIFIAYVVMGRKRRALKRAILLEIRAIELGYEGDHDIGLVQTQLSGLIRRIALYRFATLPKDQELSSLSPYLLKIFPKKKEFLQLVAMLETDRFKKSSSVDGMALLTCAKRQVKRCRI